MKPYLSTNEAATFLGLSPQTLQRWRLEGKGPMFHKFGRRAMYAEADLQGWASKQARTSTNSLTD